MNKKSKKVVVSLNRTALYFAVISCVVGIIASVLMFFFLAGDKNQTEDTSKL